jgi:hypothetical protein
MHVRGILKSVMGKLWSHPKLLDFVKQMIGPEIARHPAWIPRIDARGENGTLKVIRGGHKIDRVLPHHQE